MIISLFRSLRCNGTCCIFLGLSLFYSFDLGTIFRCWCLFLLGANCDGSAKAVFPCEFSGTEQIPAFLTFWPNRKFLFGRTILSFFVQDFCKAVQTGATPDRAS